MDLLYILGHLGGEEAWGELKRVLTGSNLSARKQALKGLNSWPDGKPAETIYRIARNDQEDKVLRALALQTYVSLLGNTSDLPDEKKVERISELLSLEGGRRVGKTDLVAVLSVLAAPEAKALADSLSSDASLAALGRLASGKIAESLGKLVTAGTGDVSLRAENAIVLGDGSFEYEQSAAAVIGWTHPGYHVAWPVKFEVPGKYSILVNAAIPEGGGGEFEVKLAGTVNAAKTGVGVKFQEIPAGSVEIGEAGTYRLLVIGVNISGQEKELMQLRAVFLKPE